jgi:MoxR-like ATPase
MDRLNMELSGGYHRWNCRFPMRDRETRPTFDRLIRGCFDAIAQVVVGQTASIELLLVALLCDGHVLIEDVPGTGKTSLAKALAGALRATLASCT